MKSSKTFKGALALTIILSLVSGKVLGMWNPFGKKEEPKPSTIQKVGKIVTDPKVILGGLAVSGALVGGSWLVNKLTGKKLTIEEMKELAKKLTTKANELVEKAKKEKNADAKEELTKKAEELTKEVKELEELVKKAEATKLAEEAKKEKEKRAAKKGKKKEEEEEEEEGEKEDRRWFGGTRDFISNLWNSPQGPPEEDLKKKPEEDLKKKKPINEPKHNFSAPGKIKEKKQQPKNPKLLQSFNAAKKGIYTALTRKDFPNKYKFVRKLNAELTRIKSGKKDYSAALDLMRKIEG